MPTPLPVHHWRNGLVTRLGQCPVEEALPDVATMLTEREQVHLAFKAARDYLLFTNWRVIAINLKGMSGKKRDYTFIPYTMFFVWMVESAGGLDHNSALEIHVAILGHIRFEFRGDVDVKKIAYLIAANRP